MVKKDFNDIIKELVKKISKSEGLAIFAKTRAKFEGWLKLELVGLLKNYWNTVKVEEDTSDKKRKIDIVCDEWAFELKTVNTSYKTNNVPDKTRPITQNVTGVIKDIKKLRKQCRKKYKIVIAVIFPVDNNNKYWRKHEGRIEKEGKPKHIEDINIKFKNSIPGKVLIIEIQKNA